MVQKTADDNSNAISNQAKADHRKINRWSWIFDNFQNAYVPDVEQEV